jgi:aspartyl-tRNA(Asn)/glutamyl-tRNA(Gln) amidotransferase subunit A
MDLADLTAHELLDLIRRKEVSLRDIVKSCIERIERYEPIIKAYLTVRDPEDVINSVKDDEPYSAIPIAIKDNILVKGLPNTCASKILSNFIAPYNATVIEKLNRKAFNIIGKTNLDEFAMGSSTENSAFGPTKNPWDIERVPGGSSGGSAASVAMGSAIWALGSDTGGSIRQPASFCGVVGLKPTYGTVSRYGLVAFASSLDQIGPITKDVTDCAILYSFINGHDPNDSTSLDVEPYRYSPLKGDVRGLRIGLIKELLAEGVDSSVKKCMEDAVRIFEDLGAIVEEVSLPHISYSVPTYYILAPAEASSNLARFDGVSYGFRASGKTAEEMMSNTRGEGFGPEVKRRIMLGTYVLSAGYYEAFYLKALKFRNLIAGDFKKAFERFDVLISPTSPILPFKLGEKVENPLEMYLADICTIPINLAGLPAISIPCGFVNDLPVGLQIIGPVFSESKLFEVAYGFEQATPFHKRRPQLGGKPYGL